MTKKNVAQNTAQCGAVYGLGMIGAFVYYITNAANFGDGVWGIVKAIVWPALMVYELMGSLGM